MGWIFEEISEGVENLFLGFLLKIKKVKSSTN
jgi:hypothetical protein